MPPLRKGKARGIAGNLPWPLFVKEGSRRHRRKTLWDVRAIEIPTPRWTAYDAKYYGLKNLDPKIPMTTTERAYTSPIWYSP